ncbi:MAG: ABC transporter permease [Rhodospirillaceae bacterium]|nr:ABC transporter permease [Rhodospirillaceae bacterium]
MGWLRGLVVVIGLIALWQAIVSITAVPDFILPPPLAVGRALVADASLLAENAGVTLAEILLGLCFGTMLGVATALAMAAWRPARNWILPVIVASQAIPVFALAPILVLWLGFGLWPKIAMATLIIYFPVASSFFDGLRRAEPGRLDLARTMGASRAATLLHIRLPGALPALASGLRVGVAVAPIGAVVGEWVGASAGLGHLMLYAKARTDTPRMFAALIVLAVLGVALYLAADRLLRRAVPWHAESNPTDD